MTAVAIRGTGASTFSSSRSRSTKASMSTSAPASERTSIDSPEPYVFVNGAHFIIFGLGNPGSKYTGTRHNIGRDYVSSLASKVGLSLSNSFAKCSYSDPVSISLDEVFSFLDQKKKKPRPSKVPSSEISDSTTQPISSASISTSSRTQLTEAINNNEISPKHCIVTFATPETYMNLSGDAVKGLSAHLGIPPERVIVLHDDLDVHLGVIKVRASGTSGGQRGIESILNHLSAKSPFIRVRMGVGRPPNSDAASFVLGKFTSAEKDAIRTSGVSVDSVSTLVKEIIALGFDKANSKWQAQIRALQKAKTPSAKAASEGLKPYVYNAARYVNENHINHPHTRKHAKISGDNVLSSRDQISSSLVMEAMEAMETMKTTEHGMSSVPSHSPFLAFSLPQSSEHLQFERENSDGDSSLQHDRIDFTSIVKTSPIFYLLGGIIAAYACYIFLNYILTPSRAKHSKKP